MIDILDPDHLVDCVGLAEADLQYFKRRNQFVDRWENPLESLFIAGTFQYSALSAFQNQQETSGPQPVVMDPHLGDEQDPLYLPLISRFGRLRESNLEDALLKQGLPSDTKYAKFAEVQKADFSGDTDSILLGLTPGSVISSLGGGNFTFPQLTGLTLIGLSTSGPSFSLPEYGREEYVRGFASQLVITGNPSSVIDLALYWNLRAERWWSWPFPLWVPIDTLDSDAGVTILRRGLGFLDQQQREGLANNTKLYVISGSMTEAELSDALGTRFPDAVFATQNLHRFLSGTVSVALTSEERELHFTQGRARLPLPKPETISKLAGRDRLAYEVGVHGVRMPRSAELHRGFAVAPNRITNQGSLQHWKSCSFWPDIAHVQLPDGWTTLCALFADRGYECAPSDKAKFAEGVLALLGDIENIGIIASSIIYKRLRELSRVNGQARSDHHRAFFANRPTLQISELARGISQETASVVLGWLIEHRLLFRGTVIRCPRCNLRRWYEVDDVAEQWRCDGCQGTMPIPLDLNTTTWSYRVNELYAHGHDQGVITHLLGIFNLHDPFAGFGKSSVLGYYPGVSLTAKPGCTVPRQSAEIDIVGIIDGKLVIAECRDSGETLTQPEVKSLVDLSNHLDCSRLLFITPTSFPDAPDLFTAFEGDSSATLEWWEATDIFDQSARERAGMAPVEQNQEERCASYLAALARRFRGLEDTKPTLGYPCCGRSAR